MVPSASESIAQAQALLGQADPPGAFGALRWAFRDPALTTDAESFVAVLTVFEAIAAEIAGPAFCSTIAAARTAPSDAQPLVALADACRDEQLWWPAACCLDRAVRCAGVSAPLLHRQCEVWIADGRYADACVALRAAAGPLADDAALRHRLALCELLRGDVAAARESADRIGSGGSQSHQTQVRALHEILGRAALAEPATPLDASDLRGWHFVTSGGLLLHLSPFGFDDGMRGRYAMAGDSAARCRQGLLRVHAVLDEWDALPQRVLLLPDRNSRILGLSAAAMFGVDAEPYDADREGLIVAYDLSTLDETTPAAVAHHRPGQMLFAHATCWTQPPPCVPDLTTYLYQYNQPPRVGPEPDEDLPDEQLPDDDATVEVGVQAILDAIVADDPDELPQDALERLVTFAGVVRPLASVSHREGLRGPLISPGPVVSSRFG